MKQVGVQVKRLPVFYFGYCSARRSRKEEKKLPHRTVTDDDDFHSLRSLHIKPPGCGGNHRHKRRWGCRWRTIHRRRPFRAANRKRSSQKTSSSRERRDDWLFMKWKAKSKSVRGSVREVTFASHLHQNEFAKRFTIHWELLKFSSLAIKF